MATDGPNVPDMLQWYDGMLLLPEHFQAAHRRQEVLGGYLARTVAPHGWGIHALATRIADAKFEVLALEALMPDGLVVQYSNVDPDDLPLEIDLAPWKPRLDQRQKLGVHLIVPAWNVDVGGREGPEAGGAGRYRSVKGARLEPDDPDAANGDAAAEMMRERPWLRPVLKLHVGEVDNQGRLIEPPSKYVALPLARIVQNTDGAIVLDRYEPPRASLGRETLLSACARSVADDLRDKAKFLSEKLQQDRGVPARSPGASSAPQRFHTLHRNIENLHALVRTVPRLQGLLQDACAHPFDAYLALCDVVGDLAMLDGQLNLPDVPTYVHRDPLASFDELEKHIRHMLESLNQLYRIIPFDRKTDGRFELAFQAVNFKAADLGKSFILGAERAKDEPARPVQDWMAKAVIAKSELVRDMKRTRVYGPSREPIDRDKALDLTAPPLTSLYRVTASDEYVDARATVLVVENDDPDGPMSILLYVPRDLPEAHEVSEER
jgi:type VI secretion system protein ImpJ